MIASTANQTVRADVPTRLAPRGESLARYDIYAGVHKGLRAWMFDVVGASGRLDYTDATEVSDLASRVRALVGFIRAHMAHEDRHVHPAMERAIPGSSQTVAHEHYQHDRALALIESDVTGLERAEANARGVAAMRLYRRLALLLAENLEHMHIEETEHNAVLWATHTDSEIAEIEQAIVASIAPAEMAEALRWMIPAMSAPERAAFFTGMRMNAPAEVVAQCLAIVRPHLSDADWTKLSAAIGPFA